MLIAKKLPQPKRRKPSGELQTFYFLNEAVWLKRKGGIKWQPTPVFLSGESQKRWSLVGCRLWGHTESDTTEATWQQQPVLIMDIVTSGWVAAN